MATRRLSISPNATIETVVEAVGAATVTAAIELTFDTSQTLLSGGTRGMTRDELLACLTRIEDYIDKIPFPPST